MQPPQPKKSTLNNHIIMRTQKQTAAGRRIGLILLVVLIGLPLQVSGAETMLQKL